MIQNILVPTDFSAHSRAALNYAISLAEKHDAKIFLLNVSQLPPSCSIDAPPAIEAMMRAARESLDKLAEIIPSHIAREELTHLGTRETVQEIIEQANAISADLIVITTHGYVGLKHFFRGSTAEAIVRQAPCPVLVTRSPDDMIGPSLLRGKAPEYPFKKN